MTRPIAPLFALALATIMPATLRAGPVFTHAGGLDLAQTRYNTSPWIGYHPTDPVPDAQGDVYSTSLNPTGGSSSSHNASNHFQGYTFAEFGGPTDIFPFFWSADSSASFTSSAGGGTLHANAVSHANINNFTQTYTFVNIIGQTIAITHNNPYYAAGNSQGTAEFHDVLHITSPTLPANAPVVIKVHFVLDSNLSPTLVLPPGETAYSSASATGQLSAGSTRPLGHDGLSGSVGLSGTNDGADPIINSEALLGTFVGDSIDLAGFLQVDATAFCTVDQDPYTFALYGATSSDAFANAANTMHSYVEVITPGVSFTSESGATYVADVPEPASLAVLALAAPLVLLRRHR
jgi:hypothetical protein